MNDERETELKSSSATTFPSLSLFYYFAKYSPPRKRCPLFHEMRKNKELFLCSLAVVLVLLFPLASPLSDEGQ